MLWGLALPFPDCMAMMLFNSPTEFNFPCNCVSNLKKGKNLNSLSLIKGVKICHNKFKQKNKIYLESLSFTN